MRRLWTRRRFLAVAGASATVGLAGRERLAEATAGGTETFSRAAHGTLRALADEIIPAGGGMPSASEAGAIRYLTDLAVQHPDVRKQLDGVLAAVERSARSRHRRAFSRLDGARRIAILADLARTDPDLFTSARNLVYEGYYTQPVVGERLGFEFRAASEAGPPLEPFDERLVERVRSMGPLYRIVP
jgi:hypothetical protein